MARGAMIEDPFHLTNSDPNVTEADGTQDVFSDIWKYQVPIGVTHVLKSEHRFSAYLEDASAEVGNSTCRIQLEVRDPAEQDSRVVLGPALYLRAKEFQDMTKMLTLQVGEDMVVSERYWIVIMVRDDGAIDASDSYFDLFVSRMRAAVV